MFPSPAVIKADAAATCRIHHAATHVAAEAFMLTEEYRPDEEISLWPTAMAEGEPSCSGV